jgi:hypothetical protein
VSQTSVARTMQCRNTSPIHRHAIPSCPRHGCGDHRYVISCQPGFLVSYQGHTGAPAGPAAKKHQPCFPAGALGALYQPKMMDGMAGGGGWGYHQPPATLPGWGHGAAPRDLLLPPLPVFGHNRLRDPNVCKSMRLHVDIPWVSFIKLGYIL